MLDVYLASFFMCFCWNPGIQGALCPCVLFGKNVESLKDDVPWSTACACHAVFVEGGIAAGIFLACFPTLLDPSTTFLLAESLFFAWWMCGIYTGLFRQELQKKYHLKVTYAHGCS